MVARKTAGSAKDLVKSDATAAQKGRGSRLQHILVSRGCRGVGKKLKSKCCKSYKEGKACKECPKLAGLTKKQKKKFLARYR